MEMRRLCCLVIGLLCLVSASDASYEQEALDRHNYFRRAHDAPMMQLDAAMSHSAQAYAQKLAQRGSLQHSSSGERPGQGENLAMTCERDFNGATAVDMWYKEVCKFNFNSPSWGYGTGHFTQIVWKESTELGIGVAEKDGRWGKCYYIVGRYRKAGNMMGAFKQNIARGCFDNNSYCRNNGAPCPGGVVTESPPLTNGPAPPTPPPPPPVPTDPTDCSDSHQHCSYWKSQGYCTSYKNYMMKNCKRSCDFCSGGGGGGAGGGGEGGAGGGGGGGGGGSVEDSDAQGGLAQHNKYRQTHNAPAMTLDAEMTRSAKAYAAKLARMGSLQHSSSSERNGQGENLAMACGRELTSAGATDMWYNEVCKYDFNGGGFSSGTGHFTQVVWKASTELGIGAATTYKGNMKCTYVVGRYRKAGNFRGRYHENVERGSFNKASVCRGGGGGGGRGRGRGRGRRRRRRRLVASLKVLIMAHNNKLRI
ncbi:uncharacterized protein LOC5518573 [Nematostella vectensis]|uniref:uncharacterized protein LOC5518573 n=1 Tax=Nematostella vectensis TaxID=45351 RepID=UPI002076D9BE|nr:uncharacterized protein LOC5518573 [Nematostella vectensis]